MESNHCAQSCSIFVYFLCYTCAMNTLALLGRRALQQTRCVAKRTMSDMSVKKNIFVEEHNGLKEGFGDTFKMTPSIWISFFVVMGVIPLGCYSIFKREEVFPALTRLSSLGYQEPSQEAQTALSQKQLSRSSLHTLFLQILYFSIAVPCISIIFLCIHPCFVWETKRSTIYYKHNLVLLLALGALRFDMMTLEHGGRSRSGGDVLTHWRRRGGDIRSAGVDATTNRVKGRDILLVDGMEKLHRSIGLLARSLLQKSLFLLILRGGSSLGGIAWT